MKISCDQATTICDKNQYGEASLLDKIKLNFHILFCSRCGLYSKQNFVMSKCYEVHRSKKDHEECCLEQHEKDQIEKEVKAEL